jgi:1-acyl-sn-glycerol-3-phosphate acyltransferase
MKFYQKLESIIVSIWVWGVFLFTAIPLFMGILLLRLFTFVFDPKRKLMHRYAAFWGRFLFAVSPFWSLKFEGREKIDPLKTYVLISNHQSLLDILVLYYLRRRFKWVSKAENFKLPFVGGVLKLCKYLEIERGNSASAAQLFANAASVLQSGCSLMMFPEGSRSVDGNIRKFKDGAFRMAHENKVAIVPIVLDGNFKTLPKDGFLLREKSNIVVRVLDPIPVETVMSMPPLELCHQTQLLMTSELDKMRSGV